MSMETQHFFDRLYPGIQEGYLVLSWPSPTRRHKDGKPALDSSWHNLATTGLDRIAARAQREAQTQSVYFGVAIQHPTRKPDFRTRSQNASAYVLPALYFDLDLASGAHATSTLPATDTAALDFLSALPSQPSLILHTGGGLHAYWLFETPVRLQTDADRLAMTQRCCGSLPIPSVTPARRTAGRSMPYAIWRGCCGPLARSITNMGRPSRSSTNGRCAMAWTISIG